MIINKIHNSFIHLVLIYHLVSFCIGFIDFMLKGKSLVGYRNLFSHNGYDNNDKIIQK